MHSQRGTTRILAGTALAGVSLIAAVVSYLHALAVVREVGATPPVEYLIPFLADLVILGATASLLDASRRRERLPVLTMLSLTAGVAVTLAMNVAAGFGHGLAGALVAGWPAVAFILALESLAGMVRRGRGETSPPLVPAASAGCSHLVAATASQEQKVVAEFLHGRDCLGSAPSWRALGGQFGIHHNTARKLVTAGLNGDGHEH